MWITEIALICCLATATLASSESKSKTKSSTELRGKRNLEYSIAHPNPVFGYRTDRRISTGHRNNYYPTHKHYITFRRGRPSPSLPPYAVQMEPLVHYSQRDPLYDGKNIPLNTGNDLVSDYQHIHPQTYGVPAPPPKIIEKPIYIKEPEPIIEIIIKESNVTLPPPPAPEIVTPAPKKKEPVHVFYVKYKKNPNGYGKDSIIYDKPIPAISPPVEDEEPQQEEPPQPQYYPPPATPAPQTPSTTLRAIIKPESDYSGNKHIHIRFEKEQNDQYKRASTNDDDSKEESAPEPVISQPQSRKFIFPPGPPQSRSPPNFPPKIINRPPPQFRPEGPRFAPPSPSQYRPFNQPPQFKPQPFPPNQYPPQPVRSNFQPPHISIDRPPAPPVQQQLPSHQHIPFRQPVAYKPFENYISNEVPNQQPPPSFAPSQVHRPINTFDHNLNQPPQSFSNFLTHFPEQQHLPHAQRHHIFHTSRPQEQPPPPQQQFSTLPDQREVPHAQNQHQYNSHPPQRLPEESKQLIHSNKDQFNHHQQFNQEQKFEFNHNNQQPQNYQDQSSPFLSQLPRLPQHQLLPTSQRLTNFNSPNQQNYQQQQQAQHQQQAQNHQQQLQHHQQQPQHQQQLQHHQEQPQHQQLSQHHQQHPQHHEEIVPPGGQLIPSVSKFEQHITLPSETKEQQTNYQPAPQQPQQQQQQLTQQQRYTIQQQQQLNNQPVRSFDQPSSQQFQHQRLQQTQIPQQQQFIQNSQQQQNNYVQYQDKPTEQRANSPDTTSNYLQKDALRQAITNSPHRFSSVYPTTTSRTTYQSTTTASTSTTKDPKKEEKAKKNVLELPDEVPDDLRQQLLSSGILENAQISVLDYDKVGDIPLSALPPEQLSQFFGAGGKDAISSGSEPIPSIISKDGDPMEDFQVDQESEGSEAVEQKISPPQIKVVEFDKEKEKAKDSEESFVKANNTQSENIQVDSEKYTRYLPIKVNGSRFPIPDVSELKNKNITSVVVLAPVEYSGNKDQPVKETVSNERMLAGQALKELIQNPTAEIFEKWIDIENKTSIDKQSVILLVTEPEEAKEGDQKEIFMYDLNTKSVSKLSGELSSAFVDAAEANTHKELEAIAPSNIIETRVPYPTNIDRQDVSFSDDEFSYDLSDAPSEVVESRIPIIDPMDETDEYEAEASEQLEQFIDISGLRVRPEDLAAAASENHVIVSSGYSKTGSNKMPSSR